MPVAPFSMDMTKDKMTHEYFMKKALGLAKKAFAQGEFPVGCILVYENTIVATGQRTHSVGPTLNEIDHAEIRGGSRCQTWLLQPQHPAGRTGHRLHQTL